MGRVRFDPGADLLAGLNTLAAAVRATYGPRGRNVLIEDEDRPGRAVATRDGVTVARSIFLENRWANMGAQIGLTAAKTTVRECGDGTSATILMAHDIANRCAKAVAAGAQPADVIRGLNRAEADLLDALHRQPRVLVTDDVLRAILHVSSHGDDALVDAVLGAFHQAGTRGLVSARRGDGLEPYRVDTQEGFVWPAASVDAASTPWSARPCLVAMAARPLESAEGLVAVLEAAHRIIQNGGAEGLLILGDLRGDALATFQRNKARISVARVDIPHLGSASSARVDAIHDLGLVTGAQAFGMTAWTPVSLRDVDGAAAALGYAEAVEIRAGQVLVEPRAGIGATPAFRDAVRGLQALAADAANAGQPVTATHAQERLARLCGATSVVVCGGATECEATERLARAEDAIQAGRAAIRHGVLPGCGISLVQAAAGCRWAEPGAANDRARTVWDDAYTGYLAGMAGAETPNRTLAASLGVPAALGVQAALKGCLPDGRPAREAGVFDPALAVTMAVRNSFSVARMILSSAVAIHPSTSRDG